MAEYCLYSQCRDGEPTGTLPSPLDERAHRDARGDMAHSAHNGVNRLAAGPGGMAAHLKDREHPDVEREAGTRATQAEEGLKQSRQVNRSVQSHSGVLTGNDRPRDHKVRVSG